MLVLFISDHERNGGLFMNKKIISLLLGVCAQVLQDAETQIIMAAASPNKNF